MTDVSSRRPAARAIALALFQDPMRTLVQRSNEVDLRAYELTSVERTLGELVPATNAMLADARALLASISSSHDRVPADDAERASTSPRLPFEHEIDATVASKLGLSRAVDEIAFMAQLELRQCETRMARLKPTQHLAALLSECDSSLRRIRKAMNAMDTAIAQAASVPPLLDFTPELEISLAVRRAYAKFRMRILAGGAPSEDALRARIRGAGTQIAILIGRDVYREMRVQDRLLLRELQRRILDWLRGGPDVPPAAGARLWQDLATSVEILALVSCRQELVAHDSELLRALIEAGDHLAPGASTRQALESLQGLDRELDDLLAASEQPPPSKLAPIIERLASQLKVGRDAQSRGESSW